ncbi:MULTISPECIES: hypothetical protein [unclassified Beijerinckia]|uniref:hypothetical protein n=1 Tax=unclassified Beijerinckia TaxID=2638183 RepID=UPI0008950095|nr:MULTISPECIES: hypothetical protein [unclassified Beijerinckia]MDH7796436.1 phage-related protein [Beijerinckia sp. GAS462]SEC44992.1 lambda-like phage minor tail protein L [Beijerinckia sp. 28-YEA-48]
MTIPASHVEESVKLTADAPVDLFEISLVGTPTPVALYLTNGPTVTWQGKDYEGNALKLSSIAQNASGEKPRPSLTLANPYGIYNPYVFAGHFDGASVTRHKVLRQHILANSNLTDTSFWYIGRIPQLIANQALVCELRLYTDGPEFKIPARMFIPPEFPFVKIQ